MTTDPLVLMPEVDRAMRRLLATVAAIDDATAAAPSKLPDWTVGHVLTHLARNADSLVNLLTWARTGVVTPQYASVEQRERQIEAGAARPIAEHARDLAESASRFAAAAAAMPAQAWAAQVGQPKAEPATAIVWRRLREIEVHHVDLDLTYQPSNWPEGFRHRLLHELVSGFAGRDDSPRLTVHVDEPGHEMMIAPGGPTVSGPSYALAAWLCGRGDGAGLAVSPAGPLPSLPAWM